MQLTRASRRRGFTLPEVLVSTFILVLLAAMTVPSLVSYKNAKDARATAATISSFSLSIVNTNAELGDPGFFERVAAYPQTLSQLIAPITTSMRSCAGTLYTATDVTNWSVGAPYSTATVIATKGVPTPLGWIRDTVYLSATPNYVELRLDSVETDDAKNIDLAIDIDADSTSGVLRYEAEPSAPGNPQLHRLRYLIPRGIGC